MTAANGDSNAAQERMLGSVPGVPAAGRGPAQDGDFSRHEYQHPAAGWGAARSVGEVLEKSRTPAEGVRALFVMNQEDGGFDCPGCAWPDDPSGLHLDICENGVKHVTWELTRKQAGREFFAAHTVTELAGWSDYDLEDAGRLSEPMRYDPASDRYQPVSWEDAFELAGRTLRGLSSPHQAAFYTSGRLSNEATFLYQLWVREFGTNNLPDCSNMCHEASGVAMTAALGTSKGTVDLRDWEAADAIWLMGDNAATNAPRMLTWLAEADRRGAALVHINPLIEAASRRTIVPHEMADMATFRTTKVGTRNVQVRIGGDMALLRGVAKAVFEAASSDPGALDGEFLERYTQGLQEYEELCQATPWSQLELASGVPESAIRELAGSYLKSRRVIIAWCLGVTQHENGVDVVREIINVLLLRGNIGREGAGPCPVRGHSNVQGNRTCGIDNRPGKQFLDRLAEVCHIDPPREAGLDVVETLKAMHDGTVKVLVSLGGNLALAAPDTQYTFEAFRACELTVHVATKLNRSHIVHGQQALILPCLAQPARERGFQTPSGRAEFSTATLPDDAEPRDGRLLLATLRSHDQFNTTIYSNNDRYRGLKGLRTVVFMNAGDMSDRGLGEFDLVDIASFSKDGSKRAVHGYRAVSYDVPRGCAAGYMPELNVLCGIADYSAASGQPITKHLEVEVTPSLLAGAGR